MSALGERFRRAVEARWYSRPGFLHLLRPLEILARYFVRKKREKFLQSPPESFDVPVIVVGNLSVGGTGKTPAIIAIVQSLQSSGYRVGVVSRGYGRKSTGVHVANAGDSVEQIGDEPMLLRHRTGCELAVGEDRYQAVQALIARHACDVVLSDDGMQHYRLPRDIEILMVDGKRGFGNGHLLPVGPLREPLQRCNDVQQVVINGCDATGVEEQLRREGVGNVTQAEIVPAGFESILNKQKIDVSEVCKLNKVVAVAGIGNPSRFFDTLTSMGVSFDPVVFEDHHWFVPGDFERFAGRTIVMTEKDAVKCRSFAAAGWLQLNVDMQFDEKLLQWINAEVADLRN